MTESQYPGLSTVTRKVRRAKPAVTLALAALVAMLGFATVSAAGHVETIVQFDIEAGELPEGVVVDSQGNVYVSLSPLGQLVRVPAGSEGVEPVGSVSGLQEGDIGLIGLAVDDADNVYGGVFSANPDTNGVWKFDPGAGTAERVPGTEAIGLPNSVVFDDSGTMYVTDSIGGGVWRVPAGGAAEPWLVDPLLAGDGSAGFPFPIGANGIDIRDNTVYVGTTETARIVTIPIEEDGSPGEPAVYTEVGAPVDGIVIDDAGNVYIAAPISNSVLRVDPDGTIDTIAGADDGLDAPTSVALGSGMDGQQELYAVNFSVAVGPPGGAGPALVKIATGDGGMMDESDDMAEGEGHDDDMMEGQAPTTMPATGSSPASYPPSVSIPALALLAVAGSILLIRSRRKA